MAIFQTKRIFTSQEVGFSVPSEPNFYAAMNQNDKYSKDVADSFGGSILAINQKTSDVNANPNLSNYYELFAGNVTLKPDKYIRITLMGSEVRYDNYENYIEMWTI